MGAFDSEEQRILIRKRAEVWRAATPELDAVRRIDADSVSVQEAVRQLFEGMDFVYAQPAPTTSGLVDQQMWFSRIRAKAEARKIHNSEPGQ